MLAVGVNYTNLKDPRAKIRQKIALEVLEATAPDKCRLISLTFPDEDVSEVPKSFVIHGTLFKDSSEWIGNNRRLPYIKELLNRTALHCDSVFGFMNSDILLPKYVFDIVQDGYDACMFYRTEIGEVTKEQFVAGDARPIHGGDYHEGCDAFFFNKDFWNTHSDSFDDNLIFGETEWDTYYRFMIASLTDNYYRGRNVYHVYHDAKWTETSKGAKNNIKIWHDFIEDAPYDIPLKELGQK